MTFAALQYPPVLILFSLAAVLILLSAFLPAYTFIPALLSGLLVIALLLCGLFYAVPLEELLLLVLLLLLLLFWGFRFGSKDGKEGDS